MGIYSILPSFGCLGVLLLIVATPLFSRADAPPSPASHRIRSIDGLRGFLALAVFFHHAAIYNLFLLDGHWDLTPSRFYNFLGPIGVSMFFMITGYLFWARVIREGAKPAWVSLYIGRIFRIGPLYLVAVAGMLLLVFIGTGPRLNVSGLQLIYHISRWIFCLGLFNGADVNGFYRTDLLLASVTWTLRWEWLFYFSLPFLSFVARYRKLYLPSVLLALAACLTGAAIHPEPRSALSLMALFLTGMTCASLAERKLTWVAPDSLSSGIVCAGLLAVFAFSDAYQPGFVLLLGLIFYLVVCGCTLFGLLVSRPARRLGDVSYGIYLLQGLVLDVVFRPYRMRSFALSSSIHHWLLTLFSAVALVSDATLAHALLERPGIALGRHVDAWRKATTIGRLAN
jgi:peptidoglycan/LPS O-acetylase OafA/YrhL